MHIVFIQTHAIDQEARVGCRGADERGEEHHKGSRKEHRQTRLPERLEHF